MPKLSSFILVCGCLFASALAQLPPEDYVVGAEDVLTITVFDQADLTGKYTVASDGTISFPLIGHIKAGGLTVRQFEQEIRTRLAAGYFRNPHVAVGVEQYKSQQIFVMGEVRAPGAYPLSGGTTLIEVLARAGASSSGEVVIVRPDEPKGPSLPGQDKSAQVTRVDLRALQSGSLAQNVDLRNGDTLFVPRADTVYVFGQVKSPGAFPIEKGTTVLQALSLAGGVSDNGATNRIKIVRLVTGKQVEIRVKLNDVVLPGDTIMVPERYF